MKSKDWDVYSDNDSSGYQKMRRKNKNKKKNGRRPKKQSDYRKQSKKSKGAF
tara:strand:- start:1313 stop:1468 length:156 start_codon:yes stop_codon:yes gene_type:complete